MKIRKRIIGVEGSNTAGIDDHLSKLDHEKWDDIEAAGWPLASIAHGMRWQVMFFDRNQETSHVWADGKTLAIALNAIRVKIGIPEVMTAQER